MSRMEAMVESESQSLRTISNAVADEPFVKVAAPRIHEYPSLPRVAVEVELVLPSSDDVEILLLVDASLSFFCSFFLEWGGDYCYAEKL